MTLATRLTATGDPARIDNAWILFVTGLSDTNTDGTEIAVWWSTDGATDADRQLICYVPTNGDPASFAASWVPNGISQLDGDPLVGVLVDVAYSDSVVTVADLIGTEVDDGATPFTASFDDGLIDYTVKSFDETMIESGFAKRFDQLADVAATGDDAPTDGQAPVWDVARSRWVPGTVIGTGGAPTGAAGGDLGGTYPNPTVPGLASKIPSSYLDTDGTLAANSDLKVPTQKAVKTFVAGAVPAGQIGFDPLTPADTDTVTVSTTTVSDITIPTGGTISIVYPADCPVVWFRVYVPAGQRLADNLTSGGADPFGLTNDETEVQAWVVGNNDGHLVLPAYALNYASETYADAAAAAAAAALVDSAPGTLDTLNELAAALGDDPDYATTIAAAIAAKAAASDLYIQAGDGIDLTAASGAPFGFFNSSGVSPDIHVAFSTDDPQPNGTPDPGVDVRASRGDHVHPMPSASDVGAPSGSGTSSGTNTGDQTITLTGDVTGTGTGSFVTAIGTGVIVNADINASAAIALSKLATDPLARANHTGTQLAATVSDFDTQVRTSRLDQMAAPTADLSINSHKLTNVTDPSSAQHAATKNYVDTTAAPATLVSTDQSGTTYTTVLADANTLIRLTNASLVTVTIPTNASVAYPLNTILTFHARGAAGGTLAAAGGVTIRNNSTATFAQYAEISVRKDGTDEWIRVG